MTASSDLAVAAGYTEWTERRTGWVLWRSSGSGIQHVLPDVNADLMFWDGELQLAGYDTTVHEFDRGPGATTYGLRLPAGMLPYLLQDSAATATDARVPISLPPGDSRIAGLVEELPGADDPRPILSAIVRHRLSRADPDPRAGRAAERILVLAEQNASVARIASSLGWSQRKLHRFCIDTFGVPASVVRSLSRFKIAHRLLASGSRPADVAAIAGYTDQSHLARHIKRFAATTPRAIGRP